ncbi:nucleotidyl transferase AbiEii/AbiGii toxin family protein [Aurantibacillus circumpalustris]|uniref:nucleotidyl transferase AbiEii/AbiGii toxin family protein n=1 Tax=Aurantibacillus circumpalustris TaxID=3036359 RepID=UPI00295BCCE8|nr:nucleotidyl transferase AbiEii/AbiGii toxin family protein [Aurantibacillus circumpalustris]
MHLNILSKEQFQQLTILSAFKREYTLVGGTAIALHIGHRKSIDFDLFKSNQIHPSKIKSALSAKKLKYQILFQNDVGFHLLINGVKWTFFYYPFLIQDSVVREKQFKIPDLLTLAAMKAYALGRRSKWKDYVDLLFIIENHHTIDQISKRAAEIFKEAFSEKMFRIQLVYFKDIDFSEEVEWVVKPLSLKKIQTRLIHFASQL